MLLSLGDGFHEESDVLPVIFGADAKLGLAQMFCQAELRDLTEIERQNQLKQLQQIGPASEEATMA